MDCKCGNNECCKKTSVLDKLHVDIVNKMEGNNFEIYGRVVRPSNRSPGIYSWMMPKEISDCYHLIYDSNSGEVLKEDLVFTESLYPAIFPYCTRYWDKVIKIRTSEQK